MWKIITKVEPTINTNSENGDVKEINGRKVLAKIKIVHSLKTKHIYLVK